MDTKEIARRAKVSAATVSHVLNRRSQGGPATRAHGLEVMEQLRESWQESWDEQPTYDIQMTDELLRTSMAKTTQSEDHLGWRHDNRQKRALAE